MNIAEWESILVRIASSDLKEGLKFWATIGDAHLIPFDRVFTIEQVEDIFIELFDEWVLILDIERIRKLVESKSVCEYVKRSGRVVRIMFKCKSSDDFEVFVPMISQADIKRRDIPKWMMYRLLASAIKFNHSNVVLYLILEYKITRDDLNENIDSEIVSSCGFNLYDMLF